MGFFDGIFSTDFQLNCDWLPANHLLFQIANICFVLTYFINPTSKFGLLKLRFVLMVAAFSFGFWGGFILCSLDTMIWNFGFAFGNGIHFIYLTIRIILKKFHGDETEYETIYTCLFKPIGVGRYQYKELLKLAERRVYNDTEPYANTSVTISNLIATLVESSFRVRVEDMVLTYAGPLEFMNSLDWNDDDAHLSTTYQVSVIAEKHSVVYVWTRENILKIFKNDNIIKNVLNQSKRSSKMLYQDPLVTHFTAKSIEMCDTSNNNQDLLSNNTPKASMFSRQQSPDLSKHLNLQSVEIPIESRPSTTTNNGHSWQNEFSADTDGNLECIEMQILLSRETDLYLGDQEAVFQ